MKPIVLLLALLCAAGSSAHAGMTSTVDPSVPASGSALSSSAIRNNFAATKSDIEKLAVELTVSHQTPSSGAVLTAPAGLGCYELQPSGTIATLSVVLPPSAVDKQIFEITTTQTITALTVTGAVGQSVIGGGPLMLTANGGIAFRYRSADSIWRLR